ncbi:MAG: sulfatase [Planctomycetes bacterium]|nr:sulfatase [Planctomycetota bacterium]
MHRTRTRQYLGTATWLGLLVLVLVGCSKTEASTRGTRPVERLALTTKNDDERSRAPSSVIKLLPTDELRFECEGADSSRVVTTPKPPDEPSWFADISAGTAFKWFVDVEAKVCQRVILDVSITGFANTRIQIYGASELLAEGVVGEPLLGDRSGPTRRLVVFDLESTYFDPRRVVFVQFGVSPVVPSRIDVHSVELVSVPAAAALAAVDEPPRLARLGGEQRRAFGLSNWSPLVARCEPDENSILAFACAVPDVFATEPGPLDLELTISDGSGVLAERLVQLNTGAGRRWVDVEFPLAPAAGRTVDLQWKLVGPQRESEVYCALTPPILAHRDAKPRSVLLVTSDTHRADHVSAAGLRHDVLTPSIDRLMASGVWFSNCLSSSNATTPSHVAMLTGMSPRDTRVVDNLTSLSDQAITLAERFRSEGFLTWAVVSANHLDDAHSGLGQGFDRLDAPHQPERGAPDSIAIAERWLDTRPGLPVFLWVHLFDAHTPYQPDDEFIDSAWPADRDPFDPQLPPPAVPAPALALMPEGLRDVEYMRALYRAEVSELDAHLPRLFEHPRLTNGVIAFTADHGESLGAHGIFWDHRGLYPQSTHVPLVLWWPGAPRGVRSDRPVTNVDIGRTLLDLAGLAQVEFPGRSLVEERENAPEPRFMLASGGVSAALEHDGWLAVLRLSKELVWIADGCHEPSVVHALELYDLRTDPRCFDDRAAAEPERARRMREALVKWLASPDGAGFAGSATRDERTLEGLRALGYATEATDVSRAWIDPNCDCPRCDAYRR